jgi:lipid-A-disaccharide synthase
VADFKAGYTETREEFCARYGLDPKRPIVALLAGSRKQEIRDNLPIMLAATKQYSKSALLHRNKVHLFQDFQWVIAGAPGISAEQYSTAAPKTSQGGGRGEVPVIFGDTYALLTHSYAAMVTSGTATLETALFRVPQVVCYYIKCGKVVSWLRSKILKVKYISLVNLVADFPVVNELVAHEMNERDLRCSLDMLLLDEFCYKRMLSEYDRMVLAPLGEPGASEHAAGKMIELLGHK